ncbi:MAG: molybdopterin-dependent oxidoreductase [Acidimicrobiia bacterium]
MTTTDAVWKQTACILCESNCGVEVRLGGADGRAFERIRGDKAHPATAGYTCEKALRLDHYQNGRGERVLRPLRRTAAGDFVESDWDTALAEIAERFTAVAAEHGGESILYFGGGGQGNHLGGAYSGASMRALGARYRSNALAQEKTGEFWVNGRMLGGSVRGDFEHTEVAMFIGKNPWFSHGFPRARAVLKEIANDPDRSMIVMDPTRTKTAELADYHLRVRPGTDAWLIAAIGGVIVQEGLTDADWLADHADGVDAAADSLGRIPVTRFCEVAGVDEELVRATARRIAAADSVAVFEDLGVQMNRHSTLVSYLEKLVWLLTGNLGKPGAQYLPSSMVAIGRTSEAELGSDGPRSPVLGAPVISGLIPCNVIAEEILTDHPKRFRAMFVESANPAHSLADSRAMREALGALDLLVVMDIFMTETAREADYVLPVPTQYEKWEATFFNFDFPKNVFHLRRPILDAPAGPLPEPEIHARLAEILGALPESKIEPLCAAAENGRAAFGAAFMAATSADPELAKVAPLVLYRTLGPTLPDGAAAAAILWGAAHRCVMSNAAGVRDAGFGAGFAAGEALFDAILSGPAGVVITEDDWSEVWRRVRKGDGRVQLDIPELLRDLEALDPDGPEPPTDRWPFVLSAGERRSFTANTIMRDAAWRKRDVDGALRVSVGDAVRLGLEDGGGAVLTTRRGRARVVVEVTDAMLDGHISLPNGMGLDHVDEAGERVRTGVSPNELTVSADRDAFAGTPWHKSVPARLEAL